MASLASLASLASFFAEENSTLEFQGRITTITNQQAEIVGVSNFAHIGDMITLGGPDDLQLGEIVKVSPNSATATLLKAQASSTVGAPARLVGPLKLWPSRSWLGRVIDAFGAPIDGKGPLAHGTASYFPDSDPISPMNRTRVGRRVATGVRAIDIFSPVCEGQRIGLFAGSGVGKSTLLGMISRSLDFDMTVVALVGERSREVREFIEDIIGNRIDRTVLVVSTSDESPMVRRLAPRTATSIAEFFRDQGYSVCLVVDSVARFAHALRDIAISSGEFPIARGFPPSVLNSIARLLERSGPGSSTTGSITAFYTVLVDGDDHNDPISDHIRGTLDGHIVLSRSIAERGRYPAVDVLKSISRLATSLWSPEEGRLVRYLREFIAMYEDSHDLRLIGGYIPGRNADLDQAVTLVPKLYEYLTQSAPDDKSHDQYGALSHIIASVNQSPT